MNTSDQINELAAALAKAQGEIQNPAKNRVNPHFKSKYADIADGLDVIRPTLSKFGIAFVQATELQDDVVILRTRMIHTSGQWIESTYPVGRFVKHQELGASLTYAKRQALFCIVGVAGDDDDDGNSATATPGNRRPTDTTRLPHREPPQPPPVDDVISDEQDHAIRSLLMETGANIEAFLKVYRVESVSDLRQSQFKDALAALERKREAQELRAKREAAE